MLYEDFTAKGEVIKGLKAKLNKVETTNKSLSTSNKMLIEAQLEQEENLRKLRSDVKTLEETKLKLAVNCIESIRQLKII